MSRAAAAIFALSLVLALAAGCAQPSTPTPVAPKPPTVATTTPPPAAEATGPAALAALTVALEPIARGLEQPVAVTGSGDGSGRLFVVEQPGRVRVVRDGRVQAGAFLDVSRLISTGGERGLLGIAFSPDFATSGVFYVNYTNTDGNTTVARFTAKNPAEDAGVLSGPDIVTLIRQPFANHNGGCLTFAPDRTLWVGMGDGGSAGDPNGNGQNPKALLGKMLSLDVVGRTGTARPKIVMSGLRNPWRFSFDRETNDLWIGDVGQNEWEEIDFAADGQYAGLNWGWSQWEGTHAYPPGATRSRSGFAFPIAEYNHSEGQSVTGGYVYRGADYPALQGTYLYADFAAGWIAGIQRPAQRDLAPSAKTENRVLVQDAGNPSSFGEDDRGELYVCDYGGTLYKVTASSK